MRPQHAQHPAARRLARAHTRRRILHHHALRSRKAQQLAPVMYGSGCGLPFTTSSPAISRSGTGSPAAFSRATISRRVADVTIVQRSGGSDSSSSRTPGSTTSDRPTSSISMSSISRSPSAICSWVKSGRNLA